MKGQTPESGVFIDTGFTKRCDDALAHAPSDLHFRKIECLDQQLCIDLEISVCARDRCYGVSFQYSFAAATVAKWVATTWLDAMSASASSE